MKAAMILMACIVLSTSADAQAFSKMASLKHFVQNNDSFHREVKAHFRIKESESMSFVILDTISRQRRTLSTRFDLTDTLKAVIKSVPQQCFIVCLPSQKGEIIHTEIYQVSARMLKKGEPTLLNEFLLTTEFDTATNEIKSFSFNRRRN